MGFTSHDRSECHKEGVERLLTLPANTSDVGEHLSADHEEENATNRTNLLKVLSNPRFLAKQCLSMRGHKDENGSNFIQLCRLRGEDDPRLMAWLKKKTDKYTSGEMQNNMLQIMGLTILRKIATCLQNSDFISIMADKTSELSNHEQLVICIRWIDDKLEALEDFIGLKKR